VARVQLTLTAYMLALAVATLAYGPLSDRYGRRPVLLAGLGIYTLAGLLCALATSLEALIAFRILQAVGGCAGLVLARTIIRDCFAQDRAAGVIAGVTMVMAVVPALSPALGGFLDVWLGWRAGFVLLTVAGTLVLLATLRWLNETNVYRAHAAGGMGGGTAGFATLLRSRVFVGYGLLTVCTLASWYTFIASAPYLMVVVLERPPSEYGMWFIAVAGGWITGNFLTSRLAPRLGAERLVRTGGGVAVLAPTILPVVLLLDLLAPATLILPVVVMGVSHGLSQPSATAVALGADPRLAGRASGLLGFVQMATGAACAQLIAPLQAKAGAWPLAVLLLAFAVLSLVAVRWAGPAGREGGGRA
jgi:MFS transporter, DHA1 family, multidrug resistance protein